MTEALLTTRTFPERAARNHETRLRTVRDILLGNGVNSVLDLGCGDGKFMELLLGEPSIDRVLGIDNNVERLAVARMKLDSMFGVHKAELAHGSFLDLGEVESGFDAAVMIEAIEHIAQEEVSLVERELFEKVQPKLVVITTPNATIRITPEQLAERGHLFEWDIPEFESWASDVASRFPYQSEIVQLNSPSFVRGTQMAIFKRQL
jgi:2-polyprenyl-3-methyl-5-hydroxy-6-metoxy-1,4-benzoquinol methylase